MARVTSFLRKLREALGAMSAQGGRTQRRYIPRAIGEQEVTGLCLFVMKKMLIKILVSRERAVSKIKCLFCHITRDTKQYFAKAVELFQCLLAAFATVSF